MDYNDLNKSSPYYQDEENVNIGELIQQYLFYWKWFVLGVIIALGLAFVYLRYAEKQYKVESKILLTGTASSPLENMLDFSLEESNSAIEDQIEIIKSRRLMLKTAKKFNLNVQYFTFGRAPRRIEIFSENSPIRISALDENVFLSDSARATFSVKIKSNTHFLFSEEGKDNSLESSFGKKINTGIGDVMILPNANLQSYIDREIQVSIKPILLTVNQYINKITVEPVAKKANVVSLSLIDNLKDRATLVVDDLVEQYNNDIVSDKLMIGEKTKDFISERLALVSKNLEGVDKELQDFKTENRITDISSETQIGLQNSAENERRILDYSTQLSLVGFMNDYLKNNSNELIPSNIGLSDASINQTTAKYNELVITRNEMLQSSTKENPIVKNLDQQIKELKNSLTASLNNYKSTAQIALNNIQKQGSGIGSKISSIPRQEKEFRNISREQQIVETLYLFLLQKREEIEISNASTPQALKIVDTAYGGNLPVAPKKNIVYLGAFLLGLIVPFGTIYMKFLLDNKVHSKKDVEALVKAPVIGEIPVADSLLIEKNDNGIIAEAFRILRTNIRFLLSGNKKHTSNIFVTSTVSGEGKTFVSNNLSIILSSSTSKNKVLLLEADIRNPKVLTGLGIKHLAVNQKGITHFLMDDSISVEEIIMKDTSFDFDIIPSGIIAPNPSELLMNGRFKEIFSYAEGIYDYVIVDTAPVGTVTDTQVMAESASMFIYVVRADYVDKRLLEIPNNLYKEKKLPNMSVLVNDVSKKNSRGYGYGYSYSYGATKELPWWKKLLNQK